jgi:hypothetical protein
LNASKRLRSARDSIAFLQLAINQAKEQKQTQIVVYNGRSVELALSNLNTFTNVIKKWKSIAAPVKKKTESQEWLKVYVVPAKTSSHAKSAVM